MPPRPAPSFPNRWDLLPLGGALGLGLSTAALWPSLPGRLPIHFNALGRPDGWMPKDAAPWLMLGLPLVIWGFLGLLGRALPSKTDRIREAQRRAMDPFRAFFTLALLSVLSLTVLIPTVGTQAFFPGLALFFALLITGIVLMALRMRGAVPPESRQHYRWGLFYVNAEDPRIWVEKLIGVGWTLNFARPAAWAVLALLLAIPATLLILLRN